MHNLASNNKRSHGVEGSKNEDSSLLQCFAGQFSQPQLPAVHLRLRGLLCTQLIIIQRDAILLEPDLQSKLFRS